MAPQRWGTKPVTSFVGPARKPTTFFFSFCCKHALHIMFIQFLSLLFSMFVSLLGTNWQDVLFAEKYVSFDASEFHDQILLISLNEPDGPQVKLFELLRCSTKRARLSHRIFVAWRLRSLDRSFPPSGVSAQIMQCADTVPQARYSCPRWSCLRFCPLSLLYLLCLRLGCLVADVCCSLFCYIGCDCPDLVVGAQEGFLLTALPVNARHYLRVVTIGTSMAVDDVPLCSFRLFEIGIAFVSVRDTVQGAKRRPMQLASLRASLMHRIYRHLCLRWLCKKEGRFLSNKSNEQKGRLQI